MAFPTLTSGTKVKIDRVPSPVGKAADLRSTAEGGYRITRRRFTRIPRAWEVKINGIDSTDYSSLESFYDDNGTSGSFSFTLPSPLSETVTVRFLEYPSLRYVGANYWTSSFTIEEV